MAISPPQANPTSQALSFETLNSRPVWEGFIENNKLDKLNKYICIDDICVGNK